MRIIGNPNGKHLKVWDDEPQTLIEPGTINQAMQVLEFDFVEGVSLMPDAHIGIGATVGSVVATNGALFPAAVGVDLNCGMTCTELPFIKRNFFTENPDWKRKVYDQIRRSVPSGFPCVWSKIPDSVGHIWETELREGYEDMKKTYPKLVGKNDENQLGTLGSGNHFIEISEDTEGNYYLVLHSGSRGIGNKIGQFFIRAAKDVCRNSKVKLPCADLSYLEKGTQYYDDYLKYVAWASRYAEFNRKITRDTIFSQLEKMFNCWLKGFPTTISCNHNFLQEETHNGKKLLITRKGAIRADAGMVGIIPGSMGAKTYLTTGLGNPDSYNSSSHGAGRAMGRRVAKETISIEEHEIALEGIVCDNGRSTLDESPTAYKNIDLVMEAQKDLTAPYKTLKQIICVKGME